MAKCRAEALSDPDQHFDYPIGMLRTEQGAVQRQDLPNGAPSSS